MPGHRLSRSPALRLLGPALALGLAVAALAGLVRRLAGGSGASTETLRSYRLEARLEVHEPDGAGRPPVDVLRGWYEVPGKSRWEFDYTDPRLQGRGATIISDASTVISYDGAINTYSRQDVPEDRRRHSALMPAMSVLLGPVPASSLEDFFAGWGGGAWTPAGEERIAGRPARSFQLSTPDARLTVSVDTDCLFVLRFESVGLDSRAQSTSIVARVTEVDFDGDIPDERFRFELPEGAREVPAPISGQATGQQSLGPLGGGAVAAPPGFLAPTYVPNGYTAIAASATTSADDRTTYFEVRFSKTDGRAGAGLVIEEQFRAGGLAAASRKGNLVSVRGREAYASTTAEETRLVWAEDEVVITLRTTELSLDELLKVAESMR